MNILRKSLVSPTWWPTNSYVSTLENEPSEAASSLATEVGSEFSCPSRALRWSQPSLTASLPPHEGPEARSIVLDRDQIPDLRNCEAIHVCGLKLLITGVLCYMVIDDWYNFLKYLAIENILYSPFLTLPHRSPTAFSQDAKWPE